MVQRPGTRTGRLHYSRLRLRLNIACCVWLPRALILRGIVIFKETSLRTLSSPEWFTQILYARNVQTQAQSTVQSIALAFEHCVLRVVTTCADFARDPGL